MAKLMEMINGPWLIPSAALVAIAFISVFLWKILRSQEGFLLGYGNWILGKWGGTVGKQEPAAPPPPPQPPLQVLVQPVPGPGGPVILSQPGQQPAKGGQGGSGGQPPAFNRDMAALKRLLALQESVLTLSRTLDGDFAYLMLHDAREWPNKVARAMQTLCSGITRVVHPLGRCRCAFFILDESDENYLVMVAGEGYGDMQRTKLALEHSCAGRAFLTGEDYYCRDIADDPVYWQSAHGTRSFRSIACVPVRAGQNVFGVICLDSEQPNAFTPEDFAHLEVFAAKLAVFCAFLTLQAGVCDIRQ